VIAVVVADPRAPACAALLAEAQAVQASTYPPEHNHSLSADELAAPGVHFFAAYFRTSIVGVGAVMLKGDYGEVKSMFTATEARGAGIGAALLERLEQAARNAGCGALRLETGEELAAAVRLYGRFGFARCGAFGDYVDDGSSVFMEKRLV